MIGQFIKFVLVGALNTLIGLGVITGAMYFFDVDPIIANAAGYLIGGVVSFVLNGKLTFRQKALSRGMLARFIIVYLVAYLANLAALWVALPYNKYGAQIVGIAIYTLVGFFGCRLFVFARRGALPAEGRPY